MNVAESRLSYFPKGFANGVAIQNMPILNTYSGSIWWVYNGTGTTSGTGSNQNKGTFLRPFQTIAYALTVALQGDIIMVKSGHNETVTSAAQILAATQGVQIFGLGEGASRATVTFTTATTASFKITGADVQISNLRFVCGVDSLAKMLDIQGTNARITGCGFGDEGTHTGLNYISFVGAANSADGSKVMNCRFFNSTAGNYNSAIALSSVQNAIEIGGNEIIGDFTLSGVHNITGQVLTNLSFHDNYVKNRTAAKPALNFISATTGVGYQNVLEAGDGTVVPALFNTGMDVSGGNIVNNGRLDAGSDFWYIKKGVVSSTITTSGVAISAASVIGELSIEDVIVKTNGTGLATGTNFSLQSNNASGIAVFFTEAVANLGANKTINMSTASVTANGRTVLEVGKTLTAICTGSNCTGAGTIDIYVRMRRVTAGANISNA